MSHTNPHASKTLTAFNTMQTKLSKMSFQMAQSSYATAYRALRSPQLKQPKIEEHTSAPVDRVHSLLSLHHPSIKHSLNDSNDNKTNFLPNLKEYMAKVKVPNKVNKRITNFLSTGDQQQLEFCRCCPHCKIRDDGMYKAKYYLKKSFQNGCQKYFDRPAELIKSLCKAGELEKLKSNGKDEIVDKENDLLCSIVEDFADGKLKLNELVDIVCKLSEHLERHMC